MDQRFLWVAVLLPEGGPAGSYQPDEENGFGGGVRITLHETEQEALDDLAEWLNDVDAIGLVEDDQEEYVDVLATRYDIQTAMDDRGHVFQVERRADAVRAG